MLQFDVHIFQMSWNHQLDNHQPIICQGIIPSNSPNTCLMIPIFAVSFQTFSFLVPWISMVLMYKSMKFSSKIYQLPKWKTEIPKNKKRHPWRLTWNVRIHPREKEHLSSPFSGSMLIFGEGRNQNYPPRNPFPSLRQKKPTNKNVEQNFDSCQYIPHIIINTTCILPIGWFICYLPPFFLGERKKTTSLFECCLRVASGVPPDWKLPEWIKPDAHICTLADADQTLPICPAKFHACRAPENRDPFF